MNAKVQGEDAEWHSADHIHDGKEHQTQIPAGCERAISVEHLSELSSA
jgi:hypothetical protein